MFGKKPGIPLDKIPPTVGLNSASSSCHLLGVCELGSDPHSLCLCVFRLLSGSRSRGPEALARDLLGLGWSSAFVWLFVWLWVVGGMRKRMHQLSARATDQQERLRVIWNKYYSESHGVVFVIDSANEARFQEAKETLRTSPAPM